MEPQVCSWGSPYRNQNNLEYLHIEFFKFNREIYIKYLAIPLKNKFPVPLININDKNPIELHLMGIMFWNIQLKNCL